MLFLIGRVCASGAEEFLAQQAQPVLTKPPELVGLLQAVAELRPLGPRMGLALRSFG